MLICRELRRLSYFRHCPASGTVGVSNRCRQREMAVPVTLRGWHHTSGQILLSSLRGRDAEAEEAALVGRHIERGRQPWDAITDSRVKRDRGPVVQIRAGLHDVVKFAALRGEAQEELRSVGGKLRLQQCRRRGFRV